MTAKIQIELVDGGDNLPDTTDQGGAAPAGPPVNPPVNAPQGGKGSPWPDDPDVGKKIPSAWESGGNVAAAIAKILGAGPLVDAVKQVADAFNTVHRNAINLGKALTIPVGHVNKNAGQQQTKAAAGNAVGAAASGAAAAGATAATSSAVGSAAVATQGPAASAAAGAAGGTTLGKLATAVGPAAIAVASFAAVLAAGGLVMKGVFDALSNQVKRLENVSGEVAVAASMTEVQRDLADMRRAQQIGPDLARFEQSRAKMEDKMHDIWTQILKVLLQIFETLEPAIEAMIDGFAVLGASVEYGVNEIQVIANFLSGNIAQMNIDIGERAGLFVNLQKSIVDLLTQQNQQAPPPTDPFLDALLAQFAGGNI